MNILVSAGEVSGDRFAAPVVAALRGRWPQARFFGAGGGALAAEGVELRHSVENLAVTGISETWRVAYHAIALLRDLRREASRRQPRLALLVDYPGLNLRLARSLRRAGVPVLYYVAPQRWAWMPFRTPALARSVDHLAVTLPFEAPWFMARGVTATYVGHPLVDLFRLPPRREVRARLGLDARPVLALLPGSREHEIARHLPAFRGAVARLGPTLQPLVATASPRAAAICQRLAPELVRASAMEAFAAADVALCKSGTSTLEAALAGIPTAVVYRLSTPSWQLARRLVRIPHVALPNLLLGREVMPEILQNQMKPDRLAEVVSSLLDPREAEQQRESLAQVRGMLGEPGVASRVASLGECLLKERGP